MSRIRRHWLPWLVVVVELVGSLGSNAQADTRGPAVVPALLALLAVVPVLLQRPPGWVVAFSGLCVGIYFTLGFAESPIFMALPAVTFAAAWSLPPRRWVGWALAGAALAATGIMLNPADAARFEDGRGPWGPAGGPEGDVSLWQALGQVALVAAFGAVGTALRSRNEARAQRQRRAVSDERVRMAADLHDGVGHGLAVIAMQAGAALHVLDRDPEAARRNLEAIRAESKESLDLLRRQLSRLTDADPADPAGPAGSVGSSGPRTPEHGLGDVPALVERVRTGGLEVSLRLDADPGTVPADVERAAYAVIQEGLTNVLRHAAASRAEVSVVRTGSTVSTSSTSGGGSLVVTVHDDGRVSDTSRGDRRPGMGIVGMRSRVEALGGTLVAGPEVRGFRLRASIPVSGSSAGGAEGLA
ncbi:signal transduction histidine kinase [Nocardioides luteus]|uniref:histidine kinase n=1 Tax=Nocardioides luteus TaxID=1844 RepID=A0ABQ5T1B5_9ACTN|nr:histidine kinase [Nocardioides luteus]MDR7310559.1 signal transduction histidine kinase [Nocardioides luteus]GGR42030.1 two-component sensor histidine kinase [Nocardioides luteus]GLJ69660.1 two-component sensor histidine kinase [Nocardioides luteus]